LNHHLGCSIKLQQFYFLSHLFSELSKTHPQKRSYHKTVLAWITSFQRIPITHLLPQNWGSARLLSYYIIFKVNILCIFMPYATFWIWFSFAGVNFYKPLSALLYYSVYKPVLKQDWNGPAILSPH